MTEREHITYEVQDIADVIGGDPHYDQNQQDVFNAHVDRVLTKGGLEGRALMRDFLKDYGWKEASQVKALEAERDTFARSSSQYQGEALRLQGTITDKDKALAVKEDEIRDLHIKLEQAETPPAERMPDFALEPTKLDNLGDYFKRLAKLMRKGVSKQ